MPSFRATLLNRLALALSAATLLAACGATSPIAVRADGDFPVGNLRAASSMLAVSPGAKALAFEAAVEKVYGRPDSLASFIARALVDSLNRGTPSLPIKRASWSAPTDSLGLSLISGPDSAILETGARYVLRVRDVTVSNSLRELPVRDVPGPAGAYERTGGGTSESCVVSFEVEIWDTEGVLSRRHSFVVTGRSDVFLWAYKSALKEAVRRAVRETAVYLRGN